jgi:hypothetical protein
MGYRDARLLHESISTPPPHHYSLSVENIDHVDMIVSATHSRVILAALKNHNGIRAVAQNKR